ncbi:MAG: hypothetical protein ABSA67_00160 [Candidatus Brocadiia bacterium]
MASTAQVAANRENALKAGVRTPEGKAISRLNARRHGIFAAALTPEDSEELRVIEEDLVADLQPAGRVEEMLVETLAMTYLRMQRCARAEAEYHVRTWQEPTVQQDPYAVKELAKRRKRGERVVIFREPEFQRMVELIGLYNVRLTNQFLKTLHEIERYQRLRAGENVPPPVVADVTVQVDAEIGPEAESASPEQPQAPEPEKSQEADAQGNTAQKRFEKTNPISGENPAETPSVIPSKPVPDSDRGEGIQNPPSAGKPSVGEEHARRSLGFLPSRE